MTFRISLPVATATLLLIPAAMLAWDLFLRPQPAALPPLSTAASEKPRPSTPMASHHDLAASPPDRAVPGQAPAPSPRHSLSGTRDLHTAKPPSHSPLAASAGDQQVRTPASSRDASIRDFHSSRSPEAFRPYAIAAPVPANPTDTGNHFTAHGHLVEVTASEPSTAGPILHIQLTETASPSSSAKASDPRLGFSLEEERFRTKWGWEAFDRVQRAALQEASLNR